MIPSIPQRRRERALNLPPLIVVSIAVLVAIHAIRALLPDSTDLPILIDGAFIPARWSLSLGTATADEVVRAAGQGVSDPDLGALRAALAQYLVSAGPPGLWSWASYALLHGSWTHVGINALWLAAFGPPVAVRAGTLRCAGLALATAIGGALAQWLVDPLSVQPMIGASAVVSGFMAAAATFIFTRPGPEPGRGFRPVSTWGFLGDRRALLFLGAWFVVNLVFGLAAGPLGIVEGAIAWEAHIGGLVVGLVLFPLIDPGRGRGGTSGSGEPFPRGA